MINMTDVEYEKALAEAQERGAAQRERELRVELERKQFAQMTQRHSDRALGITEDNRDYWYERAITAESALQAKEQELRAAERARDEKEQRIAGLRMDNARLIERVRIISHAETDAFDRAGSAESALQAKEQEIARVKADAYTEGVSQERARMRAAIERIELKELLRDVDVSDASS